MAGRTNCRPTKAARKHLTDPGHTSRRSHYGTPKRRYTTNRTQNIRTRLERDTQTPHQDTLTIPRPEWASPNRLQNSNGTGPPPGPRYQNHKGGQIDHDKKKKTRGNDL